MEVQLTGNFAFAFDELEDQHERLLKLAEHMRDALVPQTLQEPRLLTTLRGEFLALLAEHVVLEDGVIEGLNQQVPALRDNPILQRLNADLEVWMQRFIAHGTRWSPALVSFNWHDYRHREDALLLAVIEHIDTETTLAYPILKAAAAELPPALGAWSTDPISRRTAGGHAG